MPERTVLFLLLASVGLLAGEGLRWWWFRGEGEKAGAGPLLTMNLPLPGTPGVEHLELSETRGGEALDYDRGSLLRFTPDANTWSMEVYYLEYASGNRRLLKDIFDHSPEICMRASGAALVEVLPTREVDVGGQRFPVRHLLFRDPVSRAPVDVFKFAWLAEMEQLGIAGTETNFRRVRLRAALGRHQGLPARLILAGVTGAADRERAWEAFHESVLSRCQFVQIP